MEANAEFMSSGDVCEMLGVSRETLRLWFRAGKLPAIETRLGRIYRRPFVLALAKERRRRLAEKVAV